MEPLIIEATDSSPKVVFDPDNGTFLMSGDSRPENVRKFFDPLMEWLEKYSAELDQSPSSTEINFNFKFEYFNSTSAKFLLNLLEKVKQIGSKGPKLSIHWYYDRPDIDMKEAGEEFSKVLAIPFVFHTNEG